MNAEEGLSPGQALEEIDRVDQEVRRSARGVARLFLILGLCTMVYWPAVSLGRGLVAGLAGAGWIVLTIASCVYWSRMRVRDSYTMRINSRVSAMYVLATVVVFAFVALVLPDDRGLGWIAALVALSVLAGSSLVYAAWRIREVR
ncbi:hypothetical protein GCM10023194_15280 [Planotetraspora phitsanulokensis]|uniref:Uncharacterized protein n=1 Tax=Planotetraspora phitsanulokensis TaxID=575192 RepID=A0A8J3U615_9ACTN|nr:hypothetical protein [Planotetraspora phitsanulokensis]GII38860.1 hypothetical protein Pph01_38630 [Planotetraspora phitsanulokensis]